MEEITPPSGPNTGHVRSDDRELYYTVSEAAKLLDITTRQVRRLAQEGQIEGIRTDSGWKLFRYSVHSVREERRASESSQELGEVSMPSADLMSKVESLQREVGRLEGILETRKELTELAQSTIEAERDRLLQDLERERDEAQRLREELQVERTKGFWRRLFGG